MEHSRKKSCKECRYAKTRCDLRIPCARCEKKGFACRYEQPNWASSPAAHTSNGPYRTWLVETRSTGPDVSGKACHCQEAVGMMATPEQPLQETHTPPAHEDCQKYPIERGIAASLAGTHGGNEQALDGVPEALLATTEPHDACTFGPIPGCSNEELLEKMHAQTALLEKALQEDAEIAGTMTPESEPSMMENTFRPAHWKTIDNVSGMLPNILNRKKVGKIWELTTTNNIWSELKTYPIEFCEGRLPPFIHRSSLPCHWSSPDTGSIVPEALANFKGFAGMYFQKTSACHNIVLNAMFHEVNALNDEMGGCDNNSRLEALQALAMYVIVLASDQERCNLLSIMTRVTMGEMARKLVVENGDFSAHEQMGNFPTWDEWKFAESSRRTLLLIHLMDQVLDFNVGKPNITTCRHFDTLPLICSKDMWEAETSAAWDFEYTRYLSSRKGTEMLRFGDLRKSSHLDVKDLDKNMVLDLSNWATNVDSFGSMILSICH